MNPKLFKQASAKQLLNSTDIYNRKIMRNYVRKQLQVRKYQHPNKLLNTWWETRVRFTLHDIIYKQAKGEA